MLVRVNVPFLPCPGKGMLLCGSAFAICAATSSAWAQTADQGDLPGGGLQEIIVTAQKRSENLQSVPVAVTALTSDALEAQRITSVIGLGNIVPNLQVLQQPSNAALPVYSLRGVLAGETAAQVDNGVSVYIDGVYLGRASGSMFDVADIERIEVLRGPQGTLFGRNTTGGAINFITRRPSGEIGVRQDMTYGSFDEFGSRTRIDLPALGPLSASVTYAHRERDGHVRNLAAGVERDYGPGSDGRIGVARAADTLGANNSDSVFVAASLDGGGPVVADYKFDYSDVRGSQLGFQAIGFRGANDLPGTNPLGPTVGYIFSLQPGLGGTNIVSSAPLDALYEPQRATDRLVSQGHSLTVTAQLSDGIAVKNIAAYRKLRQLSLGNSFDGNRLIDSFGGSGNDFTVLNAFSDRHQHQYSDELQVLGKSALMDWVAGAFFFRENATNYNPVQFFKVFPPQGQPVTVTPADQFSDVRVVNKSYAIFGQATVKPSESLSLTLGARQTWDKRREVNFLTNPVVDSRASFDRITWQAIAEYQANPELMVYGKVGTGYLSGGIYNGKTFEPEKLISYEIGLKSQMWDNRIRLNLAAFIADYNDLQVSVFTTVLNYENAGSAQIRGLEGELTVVPVDGLQFGANLGLLDFKYKRYISSAATGTTQDIADIAQRTQTPDITFAPNVEYRVPIMANGSQLSFRLDASYTGEVDFLLIPAADKELREASTSQAHWLINGRVSLADVPVGPSLLRLSLWGQNLFDKRFVQYASDIGGFVAASFNRPRTYGLDVAIEF